MCVYEWMYVCMYVCMNSALSLCMYMYVWMNVRNKTFITCDQVNWAKPRTIALEGSSFQSSEATAVPLPPGMTKPPKPNSLPPHLLAFIPQVCLPSFKHTDLSLYLGLNVRRHRTIMKRWVVKDIESRIARSRAARPGRESLHCPLTDIRRWIPVAWELPYHNSISINNLNWNMNSRFVVAHPTSTFFVVINKYKYITSRLLQSFHSSVNT